MDSATIVTIVVAIISSGFINKIVDILHDKKIKMNNTDAMYKSALRLLMKDRLRFLCIHYIKQGWIYEDELMDLTSMHECYHNDLGGNGFLNKQMERVNSLPVKGIGIK